MTDRETFLTLLFTSPAMAGDVAVVLCGQDAEKRLHSGVQILQRGFAPLLVLSGGRDEPPEHRSAQSMYGVAMGKGVPHDRIIVESESQNTHEQAVNVIDIAIAKGWKRILLVASPHHVPRATLTFMSVLDAKGLADSVRIVPVPASQLLWSQKPDGCDLTRLELFEEEMRKCDVYRAKGHCATFGRGLEYLQAWEAK